MIIVLHAGILSGMNLTIFCKFCHSLCEFLLYYRQKILFPRSHLIPLLFFFKPSYSFFEEKPWPCRDGCHINIQFRAEHSEVFYSLHIDKLGVSVLTSIYSKKKLL